MSSCQERTTLTQFSLSLGHDIWVKLKDDDALALPLALPLAKPLLFRVRTPAATASSVDITRCVHVAA